MSDIEVQSTPRKVSDSQVTLSQVIFPSETTMLGLAKAGIILKTVDVAASLTASKHCHKRIVTASLDRMDFINPAFRWEMVSTTCRLTKVWRSSMEIEVRVTAENTYTGESRQVAIGYLVFVALDPETFQPVPVPPLQLDTPEERKRAEEAEVRKKSRLEEEAQAKDREQILIHPSDLPEVVTRTMTPDDSNLYQNVFGGVILELIHQAGEKAAFRYAGGPVIAVRQDRMSFEKPAYIGEEVIAQAVITRTWSSSMEIQTDVIARDYKTNEQRRIASSYLVFVAQDPKGCPRPVPPFKSQTDRQRLRWEKAGLRHAVRLSERALSEKETDS